MNKKKKIRTYIVDASNESGDVIVKHLQDSQDIDIVGITDDLDTAFEFVKSGRTDVLVIDVNTYRMEESELIRNIMIRFPIPIIAVSSFTQKGKLSALNAINSGAIDFVAKPSTNDLYFGLAEMSEMLANKIRLTKNINLIAKISSLAYRSETPLVNSLNSAIKKSEIQHNTSQQIIAVTGAMGSIDSFNLLLSLLPPVIPGIIFVSALPSGYTKTYADRLNELFPFLIKEAETGDIITDSTIYITPGDSHIKVVLKNDNYSLICFHGEKQNNRRPSADILFLSLSESSGIKTMGIVLTGEGKDGAYGMKSLKAAGGLLLTQDKDSSLIYGMPAAVGDTFTSSKKLNIFQIADAIKGWV